LLPLTFGLTISVFFHCYYSRTLAAIFQTTFVTPDMALTAAEKVFAHRLELKSTRRRKMLEATSRAIQSASTSQTSLASPTQISHAHGKARDQHRRSTQIHPHDIGRRGSVSSELSSGGSIVIHSESESSDGSFVIHDTEKHPGHRGNRISFQEPVQVEVDTIEEITAADVVHEVLQVVYPPI
jgi:hypothetical protein